MVRILYPGHNYLGPGNDPSTSGQPVDYADRIAQEHDWEYKWATKESDILDSDRKAINLFATSAAVRNDLPSTVGLAGLTAKHLFESGVGRVIYPTDIYERTPVTALSGEESSVLYSRARWEGIDKAVSRTRDLILSRRKLKYNVAMSGSHDTRSAEPDPKKLRTDGVADGQAKTDTNSASGPSGAAGVHMPPVTNFTKGGCSFKHKRIFTSFVHNFQMLKIEVAQDENSTKAWQLVTPYAYVPCDLIGFYVTPNEIDSLPPGTECTKFTTKVRCMGYRLPFQTQASGTTYANSMCDIICAYGYGLCNTFNGHNSVLTYDSTNATKVLTAVRGTDLAETHWPDPWTDGHVADITTRPLSAAVGNIKPFTRYYCATGDLKKGAPGEPMMMDYVSTFDILDKGGVDINYEYRPDVCVLKPTSSALPYRTYKKVNNVVTGSTLVSGKKLTTTTLDTLAGVYGTNNSLLGTTPSQAGLTWQTKTGKQDYYGDMHIEMAGLVGRGMGQLSAAFLPPTLHVGGLPLDASVNVAQEEYVQPLVIMWEVLTEMSCAWNYSFTHASHNLVRRECQTYWPQDNKYLADSSKVTYGMGMRVYDAPA